LADRLTEQSRDGWDVVAIVPTGSTVTAFLSRGAGAVDEQVAPSTTEHVEAEAAVVAEPASEPEVAADETVAPEAESTDDAGWAALASEVAASADDGSPSLPERDSEVADVAAAAGVAAVTEAAATTDVAAATEVAAAADVASASAATSTETAAAAAASSSAAPAGWYADPSSRFELRYWDGNQWTEHVSRAGQQYTDPPVA